MRSTEPLTKADEKELYSDIMAKCPAGYVKDILTDMQADVERAITSDFGFITFGVYLKEQEQNRADMLKARDELSKLQADIRTLKAQKEAIEVGLYELRKIVANIRGI
jgi:hypothetical protein